MQKISDHQKASLLDVLTEGQLNALLEIKGTTFETIPTAAEVDALVRLDEHYRLLFLVSMDHDLCHIIRARDEIRWRLRYARVLAGARMVMQQFILSVI